jgi:hypothetical protein
MGIEFALISDEHPYRMPDTHYRLPPGLGAAGDAPFGCELRVESLRVERRSRDE